MPKDIAKDIGFWNDIPKSKYSRLSDFAGQTLRVYGVGDFVGEYSECFVLFATVGGKMFDTIGEVKEILVSKGYDTRDIICKKLQDILGEVSDENIHSDTYVEVEVNKRGRFYAIEQPGDVEL